MIPSNHLIYCSLLTLPSIFPSIRVFSNESALHIRCQSLGTSASASVLPMNIQRWFPRNTFQGSEGRSLVYIKYHGNSVYKEMFWCLLATQMVVPAMFFYSRIYLYTVDVIRTPGPLSSLPVFTIRILISVLRAPTSSASRVGKPQNGIAAHESSLWKAVLYSPSKVEKGCLKEYVPQFSSCGLKLHCLSSFMSLTVSGQVPFSTHRALTYASMFGTRDALDTILFALSHFCSLDIGYPNSLNSCLWSLLLGYKFTCYSGSNS